jgi:hypothetical protein
MSILKFEHYFWGYEFGFFFCFLFFFLVATARNSTICMSQRRSQVSMMRFGSCFSRLTQIVSVNYNASVVIVYVYTYVIDM